MATRIERILALALLGLFGGCDTGGDCAVSYATWIELDPPVEALDGDVLELEVGSTPQECTLDANGYWRTDAFLDCLDRDLMVMLDGDLNPGSAGAGGAAGAGSAGTEPGRVGSVGFFFGEDEPAGTPVRLTWSRASGERVVTYAGRLSEPVRIEDDPESADCDEAGNRQTVIPN